MHSVHEKRSMTLPVSFSQEVSKNVLNRRNVDRMSINLSGRIVIVVRFVIVYYYKSTCTNKCYISTFCLGSLEQDKPKYNNH